MNAGGGEAGSSQEAGKRNEDSKKKWGVGEEMRKEAAHGVTDGVIIGQKREERERGRR